MDRIDGNIDSGGSLEYNWGVNFNLKELRELFERYTSTDEEKKMIEGILSNPSFHLSDSLRDFVGRKNGLKVVSELFKIILRLIVSKNEIGFSEFNCLDIESLNLDEKNEEELESLVILFDRIINNTFDVKKLLKFTYLLSIVKNKLLEKRDSIVDKEDFLKKNLEVGDIVLINKKVRRKDIGTKLLEAYDNNYDTDFGHVVIITGIDPLIIRHSIDFFGVEEIELKSYLNRCNCLGCDLLCLRPSKFIKNKIMDFSEKILGKKYSNTAAVLGGIYGKDVGCGKVVDWIRKVLGEGDDCYNCVEIIVQALDQDKLKYITHPNEFLEYMNIFIPVYMTTL